MDAKTIIDQTEKYYLPVFGRYQLALTHGKGCKLYDADGNEYLDFLAGIAVNSLGHAHPALVKAISEQAAKLMHCSNIYYTDIQAKAVKEIIETTGFDRVFLANSGAEANEGAIKLARKYGHQKNEGKYRIITAVHSFHGRTMMTVTATGQPKYQQGYEPLPAGFDYVPYGATTEGFGGTFATQENFRLMREALDKVGAEVGKYIRLCNYCSGLCMPEIAAMGAIERLDVMLNDALYGILFRDINMQRTMIDQNFSRIINGFAGVIINTGEDNYLTTADAFEEAHTVLASQFINEQFALLAGLPEEQMGLGHAFEMDPELKNGFLYELSQAQMAREIFPKAPLKYMPPTKFMTGNIFKGHIQDALFNMVTIMTNQRIHLLGMLTEALHTPFMSDRALSIENAQYIFNNMESISEEIQFKEDGLIQKRAGFVLEKANELLEEIEQLGLFDTLEKGIFGGVKRPKDGGKGLNGVVSKDENYYNPFVELMLNK